MDQNPYQPPATEGRSAPPRTFTREVLIGAWRGLRTGVVSGLATAVCIMIAIGAMFPTHPIEAIGVYNFIFLPLFFGIVFGFIGSVIGSVIAGIVATSRK